MEELLKQYWESQAKLGLDGVVSGNSDFQWQVTVNYLLRHLDFDDKKILDAGCGVGRLIPTFILFSEPTEVVGLDWSEGMLEAAKLTFKDKENISFIQAPMYSIPKEDKYFDMTVAFTSLCHIMDDKFQDTLNELSRVTKKEIVIVDPTRCTEKLFIQKSYMSIRNYLYDYKIPNFVMRYFNEYVFGEANNPDSLRTFMYFTRLEAQ